jgi:membrane peptidoglycan carboxypeptidase
MVLVAMLRQPDPDPNDPQGSPGYDPARGAKATENSRNRWNEIRTSMVALKYLTQDQADAMTYPTTIKPYAGRADRSGMQRPVGLVANHVLSELTTNPSSQFKGMTWSAIRDGGYKIYTTIDPRAQAAVETSADAAVAGSVMAGQPANLQSAAVLVEPGTGRVQGYFGGHDGMGADYAGFYYDEKGGAAGFGAHPPGSSFMVQTLAGGLKAGVSLKSNWQWTPHDMPGRTGTAQIRNASTCPSDQNKTGACSLLDSTVASLNVSFYGLTASVTPAKVLEMARDAGIDSIWTDSRERQDLSQVKDMGQVTPAKFDIIVGLGQYPVTVLDQANAMATYAAGGVRAEAHFVAKVIKDDKVVYGEKLPTSDQRRILSPEAIADLDYALSQTQAGKLTGRDSASKTGSWEYNGRSDQNAHAWMVGYTTSLAMAVWIGGKGEEVAIKDSSGSTIWGSGLPAKIYRDVMNTAHDAMKLTPAAFPPPAFVGTDNPPGAIAS